MNYSTWITTVCTLLEVPIVNSSSATPSGTVFDNVINQGIAYTENRIQKDLDLINTYATDSTASLTANARTFTLPSDIGTFVVVQQAAIIVNGNRQAPMTPVSREFLDFSYPLEAALGTPCYPLYWCPYNGTSILVGPAPDSGYPCEIVGTVRVTPLSATNTTNLLTVNLPDLYVAASMVWFTAFQRDWGSSSDDPKMAMSWETTYQTLKTDAGVEEFRKKFQSVGFSSRLPSPIASPPQT